MREKRFTVRTLAAAIGAVLVVAFLVWFAVSIGTEYDDRDVDAWCRHAQALDEAKMRDRAHTAYRRLHDAGDACDATAELAELRFWMARREKLLEGARAYRRAADLSGRVGHGTGRREALRDAFAAYQDALAIDPFARGARQGFIELVARYREIDPLAPNCTRSRGVAAAGLLPEARLYLSRALRERENGVCRSGLTILATRRAAAYLHLRVAQAREAADDRAGARAAYAATLAQDSSQRLALAGLDRAEPSPLVEKGDLADDIWDFLGDVLAVVPSAIWALIVWLLGGFLLFWIVWTLARAAAGRSDRAGRIVDRLWLLKHAPRVHIETEGTSGLSPTVSGIVEDTLAQLRARRVDDKTGRLRAGLSASPKGSSFQSEEAFNAVPQFAFAEQVVRFLAKRLRATEEFVLVLEHAEDGSGLAQRWRVVERQSRRTLERVAVTEDDFPVELPEDKRLHYFSIVAGEALRGAVVRAEAQLSGHN